MEKDSSDLFAIERRLWELGYARIAGVDEAGRGPLAGPVVAAAVIFAPDLDLPEVRDSKALSDSKRRAAFEKIVDSAEAIGIGVVWQNEIDRINILQATLKAMRLAVEDLSIPPDYVLIDGNQLPELEFPCESVVDGDARCFTIAAASIVAKVIRDDIMIDFDRLYPQYGFARNKGYGTRAHREALKKYGPCPLHRKSFNLGVNHGGKP